MTKDIWINLPVKDINKSTDFFSKIGFTLHPMPSRTKDAAALSIGDNKVMVMLYELKEFEMMSGLKKLENDCECELMFSVTVESREEVDTIADAVKINGGKLFAKPQEKGGWMYGCGFADLDGHRWNIMYLK